MKKLVLITALSLITTNIFALMPEPSVKGAALGGAYLAGSGDDIFASSFNPASQVSSTGEVGFAWHKAESAESVYSLGFGYNFNYGLAVNAFGNYLDNGDIDLKGSEVRIGGSWNMQRAGINLPLTVGLNLKQGWVDLPNYNEHALVGDVAVILSPLRELKIGASYSNIGGKKGMYADDTYGIGASYLWLIDRNNYFNFRMDLAKEDDHGRTGFGVQYTAWQWLSMRLGYMKKHDTDNFTFGLGVNAGDYGRFDAAYLPYDHNKTYKLSYVLPFAFGGPNGISVGNGAKYYSAASSSSSKSKTSSGAKPSSNSKGAPGQTTYNVMAQQPTMYYQKPAAAQTTITDSYMNQAVESGVAAGTAAVTGVAGSSSTITSSPYPNARPRRYNMK